jgi:hypothetical protein
MIALDIVEILNNTYPNPWTWNIFLFICIFFEFIISIVYSFLFSSLSSFLDEFTTEPFYFFFGY